MNFAQAWWRAETHSIWFVRMVAARRAKQSVQHWVSVLILFSHLNVWPDNVQKTEIAAGVERYVGPERCFVKEFVRLLVYQQFEI